MIQMFNDVLHSSAKTEEEEEEETTERKMSPMPIEVLQNQFNAPTLGPSS